MSVNITAIESELKKRTRYKYIWGRKQNDAYDQLTNFIYEIGAFDPLIHHIQSTFTNHPKRKELGNYAVNRWYNFHSAVAVEHLFCMHKLVRRFESSRDKYADFYINEIPFDHKTSVFPKNMPRPATWYKNHPAELADWLYTNQSEQQRQHFANRIFLILHSKRGAHWKLKAEISYMKKIIHQYLDALKMDQLITLTYTAKKPILTDLIWIEA